MKNDRCVLYFALLFLLPTITYSQTFTQLGSTLAAEARNDRFGEDVSMSGHRVAISGMNNQGSGPDAGHVRVFEWDGSDWQQLGNDIDAEAAGDHVRAISMDGDRLAVGAYFNDGNGNNSGHIRVFEWDGSAWVQLGDDIDGEAAGDAFGNRLVLKGSTLVGASYHNGGNGYYAGHVRVFHWDGIVWSQQGSDIDGEAASDMAGNVAFDGKRIAIGAHYNNGGFPFAAHAGHVRVYEWGGTDWVQVGADINGEQLSDLFGQNLAIQGNRLAASSLYHDSPTTTEAGYVRIFDWDGSQWVPVGNPIAGDVGGGRFGREIRLRGNAVLVSGSAQSRSGKVTLFQFDGTDWVEKASIASAFPNSSFGTGLAWEQDYVAIGEPFYSRLEGQARIYRLCTPASVVVDPNTLTLSTNTTANSYQWVQCSGGTYTPIAGASSNRYTAASAGSYALITNNGTCVDTSDCVSFTFLGQQLLSQQLPYNVYPNPAQTTLQIDLRKAYAQVELSIHSLEGKLWQQTQQTHWQSGSISLENLPSGSYILTIRTATAAPQHIKLLKQ
jgi:hypothetical protein